MNGMEMVLQQVTKSLGLTPEGIQGKVDEFKGATNNVLNHFNARMNSTDTQLAEVKAMSQELHTRLSKFESILGAIAKALGVAATVAIAVESPTPSNIAQSVGIVGSFASGLAGGAHQPIPVSVRPVETGSASMEAVQPIPEAVQPQG